MTNKESLQVQNYTLDSCIFFSTLKLARELSKIADDAFASTGLSPSHALLLFIINEEDGVPQKEIGERLHLMPSTITRLIEKLENKGFVTKQSEGKNVFLLTTNEGQGMQQRLAEAFKALHGKYENCLTPSETLTFLELSNKLLKHFESNK